MTMEQARGPASLGHVTDPDPDQDAYDVCSPCGRAIRPDGSSGAMVTIIGFNRECYGRR